MRACVCVCVCVCLYLIKASVSNLSRVEISAIRLEFDLHNSTTMVEHSPGVLLVSDQSLSVDPMDYFL